MTIYIVWDNTDYYQSVILGIFNTQDKASLCIKEYCFNHEFNINDFDIEQWEVK